MKTSIDNNRSGLMKNAHRLMQVTGKSLAESVKSAWVIYRLSEAMQKGTVQFFYKKTNGEVRQAFGTMKDDVISSKIKGTDRRKPNKDLFVYYDTEKSAFRSFKKFNLIRIA